MLRSPGSALQRVADDRTASARAAGFAGRWETDHRAGLPDDEVNPLRASFDAVTSGPGVWKWLHYFDIYHRHLERFVGKPVTIVEIGVYSGGSLSMWRS